MIFAKKVATNDQRFTGRATYIYSLGDHRKGPQSFVIEKSIPIPDNIVLCNGCNKNIYKEPTIDDLEPGYGYLVYLDEESLSKDQAYDIYCNGCRLKYFPQAEVI